MSDSLLADYLKSEDLIGESGLLKQLTKLLVENSAGNTCNGKSRKTLKGMFGYAFRVLNDAEHILYI